MTPYFSRGPVEAAAAALLPDALTVRSTPKSPLGPRALRVDGDVCVDWLRVQPWVAAVHHRPFGAYVAPTTLALYEWVVAAFDFGSEPEAGTEGAGREVAVRCPDPMSPPRLDDLRAAATAESVRRLLAARGFTIGPGGCLEVVTTGSVDVPNGPLRARLGGFVYPGDLVEEIALRLRIPLDAATALLRYALLRQDRTSSVTIDERGVYGQAAEAFMTLTLGRGAEDAPLRDSRAFRALLLHLDLFPPVVARAATNREPALLVRFLDTLAERLRVTNQRPNGAQGAVNAVAERGLRLAGLDVVRPG